MRLISPPNLKTTIYDKNITGIVYSKSIEYHIPDGNVIANYIVPDGFIWVVNSVGLRLGYTNRLGSHALVKFKVCVNYCNLDQDILGLSLYPGDDILEKNMSISPSLPLFEDNVLVVYAYMAPNQDPVFVSYYIAITQIEK